MAISLHEYKPVVSKRLPGTVVHLTKARTVRTDIDDDFSYVLWAIIHPLNLNNKINKI